MEKFDYFSKFSQTTKIAGNGDFIQFFTSIWDLGTKFGYYMEASKSWLNIKKGRIETKSIF